MSSADTGSGVASNQDLERSSSTEELSSAEHQNQDLIDAIAPVQENHITQSISLQQEVEAEKKEQPNEELVEPKLFIRPSLRKAFTDFLEHPLVVTERHERDITAKIGEEVNLDENFVVSNYKSNFPLEKAQPYITTTVYDVVTKNCYPNEGEKGKVTSGEDWGNPRCLAVIAEKHIAVGTSKGVILIFNFEFTRIQKFGTSKEREYGAVVTMDIANKTDDVIAGYENGNMVLWSMTKNERLKTINPPEKNSSLLCIKYFRDSEHFLLSTSGGSVYQYKVESILFQWRADKKLLNLAETEQERKDQNKALARKDTFEALPNGFFEIQPLSKKLSKVRNPNKNILVALASMKEVIVISLEPFRILYRHARPVGMSDIVTPSISWGTGAMPDALDNTTPLLVYSWGKTIHLVQAINIEPPRGEDNDDDYFTDEEEDEDVEKIKVAGYFSVKEEEITFLQWISSSTILAYNAIGQFMILYSGCFKSAGVSAVIKAVNYNDVVLGMVPFEEEINYQVFNGVSKSGDMQKNVLYYSNTVKGSGLDRQLFIMGKKKMLSLKHLEWQEYVDSLCKKSEWLEALYSCVSMYRNQTKAFANIPNGAPERKRGVHKLSVDLVKRYMMSIQQPVKVYPMNNSQNAAWISVLLSVIDLMILIENYGPLFSDVQKVVEDMHLKELFLETLEPFILKGRIKLLSNDAFKEIVKFYTEKKKIDVLQYLVINLSTKEIDMDNAIILCMQYNLLTALMYLCAHKDDPEGPDLLTPMASSLGRYQRSVEESNPNQEYGLKFLWFLSMTLNGRLFPNGALPKNIWESKVKDTIVLLFEEYNLDLMLTIEPYVAFEILELYFQADLAQLVRSFSDSSVKLMGSWTEGQSRRDGPNKEGKVNEALKNDINRCIAAQQNTLQGQIIGLIYHCSKKSETYYNHLYYFLGKLIVKYNCKLPYGIMEETLMYILQNAYQSPPWYRPKNKAEEADPRDEFRSNLILGLLKELEPSDLTEINALVDKLDLIDVQTYMLGLNKDLEKAFDLYLSQSTPAGKNKVFNWLRDVIPIIRENDEDFDKLKKMLLSKLHDLVAINGEKTRSLLLGLGSDLEMEVIQYLENTPHLQLDYIKEVIAKREDRETIPDELLILHIKLLCTLDPKQVIKEIRAYNYPLDACLKLASEYKVKDALALLYERTGHLNEALEIHLEIFKEYLDKKITNIREKSSFFARGLNEKFDEVSNACTDYTKLGTIEIGKMWLSVLDRILGYYQDSVADAKPDAALADSAEFLEQASAFQELRQAYVGYISSFIEEMSKSVPIENILKKLKANQGLKLGELKDAFLGMLLGHFYETNILNKATELVMECNVDNTKSIYKKSGEAVKIEKSKIWKDDDADKATAFLCGHVYSQNQLEDNACLSCMETEAWKAQNIIRTHTTKTILSRGNRNSVGKSPSPMVAPNGMKTSQSQSQSQSQKSDPRRAEQRKEDPSKDKEKNKAPRKRKFVGKWYKPEIRTGCLDKLDRFDDWRGIDMFEWNKLDELPKYGRKIPLYHKTSQNVNNI